MLFAMGNCPGTVPVLFVYIKDEGLFLLLRSGQDGGPLQFDALLFGYGKKKIHKTHLNLHQNVRNAPMSRFKSRLLGDLNDLKSRSRSQMMLASSDQMYSRLFILRCTDKTLNTMQHALNAISNTIRL